MTWFGASPVVQRVLLGGAAAAIQVAGCLVVWRFHRSGALVLAAVGFYLWSWLALALGEVAVAAPPGPRKRRVALLTCAGVASSGLWLEYSMRTGHGFPLMAFLSIALALNVLGAFLLGTPRDEAGRAGPPPARGGPWARAGARLAGAVALGFVAWLAAVASVSLTHAVEPGLIGDLRTLVSAEAAYADVNLGFYDSLECLQTPSLCLPGYPASAPAFLETKPWSGTLGYFRRRLVPGPAVAARDLPPGASASSMRSYAYVAVPAEPDGIRGFIWRRAGLSLEGVRSFCADATGLICASDGRTEPRTVDGLCAPGCDPVQ